MRVEVPGRLGTTLNSDLMRAIADKLRVPEILITLLPEILITSLPENLAG
jgi:hypothetical protein